MYLSGPTIDVLNPDTGAILKFDSISIELDQALRKPGAMATNVYMEQFAGGWLANGCPLNVYFGQGWLPGQEDALRAAGKTACLPAAGSSPTINVTQAPAYSGTGFTATGNRVIPGSGVQTPSAPIYIQAPDGQPIPDFGMEPPPGCDPGINPNSPACKGTQTVSAFGDWGMLALGALALGLFLRK
jgi:hypothetical protein